MVTINYPEMQGTSEAEIQAEYSFGKYRVTSKKELPIKRGVTFNGKVSEFGSSMIPNKRAGWFKYYMTPLAFDKMKEEVVLNILLD